jgi:hypothetical protein
MTTNTLMTPAAVERELRQRLTHSEYRVLQARLTGAVKAIATLRERAPDLVPLMFGHGIEQARALPLHTQSSLAVLVEQLLTAAITNGNGRINRKRMLKLVSRVLTDDKRSITQR